MPPPAQSSQTRRRSSVSLENLGSRLFFGIVVVLLWVVVTFWKDLGRPWGPGVSAGLVIALFVSHLLITRRRLSPLDPAAWIIVSMIFFYFGIPIGIEFIGASPWYGYHSYRLPIVPQDLERGYCIALLGVSAYIWGLHLVGLRDLSKGPDPTHEPDHSLTVPGFLLFALSTAMVLGGVALVGPSVVFGRYDEWWAAKQSGADARWIDIGLAFLQASVYALLTADLRRAPLLRLLIYATTAGVLVIHTMKGARAQMIAFAVAFGWCYTQRVRRPRVWAVLAAAFVALIVLPVIKEWRQWRSLEETRGASVQELVSAAMLEMGSSVNTFLFSLDFIPSTRDYAWGASYGSALIQAIPNLSLTPGRSWGQTDLEDHPSQWLTSVINPEWHASGGGYGTTMIGELYFNFGMAGVVLGSIAWGMLTSGFRNASQASALRLVTSALFFGVVTIHVRNVIGAGIRQLLWPFVALWVFRTVVSAVTARPSARAPEIPTLPSDAAEPRAPTRHR